MEIITRPIDSKELQEKYTSYFKTLTKAVVDIRREIIALDGDLHADLERLLLENGSHQEDLWGVNIYPFRKEAEFIEYLALINIRPHQNNFSMNIEKPEIKDKIERIVRRFIKV